MKISIQYDYKRLIQAYLDAHQPDYVHKDFKVFYQTRLSMLEQAFGISFDSRGSFKMLFDGTVRSYWSIRTPMSGWLEAGLLYRKLEEQPDQGQPVNQHLQQIGEYYKLNREEHLQLLYDLFNRIYSKTDKIVTSEDLLALGFDDATEPQIEDYFDYL